jgi:hypothetical protein
VACPGVVSGFGPSQDAGVFVRQAFILSALILWPGIASVAQWYVEGADAVGTYFENIHVSRIDVGAVCD